jgi:carbon monoxide dehydrogenase subunit G
MAIRGSIATVTRMALITMIVLGLGAGLTAVSPASSSDAPDVAVREARGVYSIDARFAVAQPPAAVLAVLTDYDQIARYMPNVKKSVTESRSGSRAVIEQEAVSKMMIFSKRVHLRLEVEEGPGFLRFRDLCGESFTRYEGSWTVTEERGRTLVYYQLTAKPAFDVPPFILKRLLKRDSAEMVERLRKEVARRSGT